MLIDTRVDVLKGLLKKRVWRREERSGLGSNIPPHVVGGDEKDRARQLLAWPQLCCPSDPVIVVTF